MNASEDLPEKPPSEPESEEITVTVSLKAQGEGVNILHPGYNRTLLSLPAFRSDSDYGSSSDTRGTSGHYGVIHRLVLDACRIVTNNRDG